jgi:hypothetical protein
VLAPLVLRKMTAMESTAGRRMPRALLVEARQARWR